MYLKQARTGDLVEIMEVEALVDPFEPRVRGRLHVGEELQDPEVFTKTDLLFPSGEPLPRCWTDGQYRMEGVMLARGVGSPRVT
ncbi:acetyltransferase [Ectothiorhodospiraceae bacterium 2226]|nr:acetyltransferase [Ectothiorhodospiraceae bacterium 2226]